MIRLCEVQLLLQSLKSKLYRNHKMKQNTTLHFFSGKMAAGKSTLAKQLVQEENAILLTEDEWLKELYENEIQTLPDYLKYSSRLKTVIKKHVISLLSNGITVVMDFPGNTKQQRAWFREIFTEANVTHMLHYVEKSDEVCKQQLRSRSEKLPHGAAFTSEKEFEMITKYFQAPQNDENFNTKIYKEKSFL